MNIHLVNDYKTIKDHKYEGHFDINDLEKYLNLEFKKIKYKDKNINYEVITDIIIKYVDVYLTDTLINVEDSKRFIYDNEITIINIDQLVHYFKYLTIPAITCCDNQTGNYCSQCGKKLK